MAYLYGPQDASYPTGGVIQLVAPTPGVPLTGGSTVTVGANDAAITSGTPGFLTNVHVYIDGVYDPTTLYVIPDYASAPWTQTGILPGTGTHNYGFIIWTESSFHGNTYHQLYLTDSGGTGPGGLCPYGTEQKDPSISVIDLFSIGIGNLLSGKDPRWVLALVVGFIGRFIYLQRLCSTLPPPDEDFDPTDFIPSGVSDPFPKATRKAVIKVTRLLWDQYCQCKAPSGGGARPPYSSVTNITQPTWYVTNNNYTISNYDIANTLNLYLTLQGGSTHVDTPMLEGARSGSPCSPEQFEEGIVHDELVGEGRFDIANVVGFKIEAIERNISEPILSGQPQYLWNMGWISTLAGELLLEEKRVTRSGYYWFPCSMQHATEFTYTLREYTKLRVTELVKPASIVLMG